MKHKLTLVLLSFFLGIQCMVAQQMKVTGVVINEDDGEPVIGASIVVKGTTVGTITDLDGKFELEADKNAKLVVSYVGLKTLETTAQANMRVILSSDAQELDDIIVVAYGTAKKSSFTGSAGVVGTKDLDMRPLTNATAALEGNVSGVQVGTGSGRPGDSPNIRIRGFGSINASNAPLYVVDGSIYNGEIADINPNDIESMSILKDAASTSLYGSSAGNGVVLITTKKAKNDDTQVTFSTSQGISSRAIKEYNRVGVWDYYPLQWEMLRNQYISANGMSATDAATEASAKIYNQLMYNPYRGVANDQIVGTDGKLNPAATQLLWGDDMDWNDAMERTGYRGEYNLSYSTKGKKSDTYVSLGYLNDNGYVIKSDFERYSARANVNVYPVKWFKTGLNISASRSQSQVANTNDNSGGYSNHFMFARTIGPIYPIHKHDPETGAYILDNLGQQQYDYDGVRAGSAYSGRHVVAETLWNNDEFVRDVMNARAYMDFNLYEGLKVTLNGGLETSNNRNSGYDNKLVGDGSPSGRFNLENTRRTTTTFNQLINYNKKFGDHNFDVLLGHESFAYKYQYNYTMRQGQVMDGLMELGNFTTINSAYSYTDEYKKEGYFARINYDFMDKYYVSASYRRDGSSRFHKDNRWGNFWSFGASWRIDQESFMESLTWINSLKLRGSYGQTGNDQVLTTSGLTNYYPYQTLYDMNRNNALEAGVLFNSFGNTDLQWETQVSSDVAIEFGLFDRLTGSVEYFNKQSKDLLFNVPLPLSSGAVDYKGTASIWKNIGKVNNSGVEISLDYRILKNADWTWNFGVNATFIKNKVKSLPQKEIIDGTKKIMVGKSIYEFWLKEYVGVDPQDGAALYRFDDTVDENGNVAQIWDDTDCRTVNGEKVTTNQEKAKYHYAGSAIPKVYGGFNTSVKFKDFELSAVFSYALGGKVYNSSYLSLMSVNKYGAAMHTDIYDRWQKPGDITNVPRLDGSESANFNAQSDRWLMSSDYLSMKSLTFAYTLPKAFLSKFAIKNARVSLSGENLFLLTSMKGMDPQQQFSGITNNAHIPARSFTFGLNFTF